ncbi:hypothetical protein BZG36_00944 [Bifiguratus adelaidae]|uniref:Methyltransferase domain-containing protein n=1 Tax=Bifiguratus adelaidae TaxID=1938954 RepID=A0A261Y5F8_9FUNG|nr:hypothetical protein BZG36_00944 [Bifiguratus adelaidae]
MGVGKAQILSKPSPKALLIPVSICSTAFAVKTIDLRNLESDYRYLTAFVLSLIGLLASVFAFWTKLEAPVKFVYSCFLKPLGKHDSSEGQKGRLEAFYSEQAEVYDATRGGLLRGRTTMLRLCAAQLREQKERGSEPLVWIDIGGGTGWNIEKMDQFMPIKEFDKVYLVDLCPSLCKVAEARFQRRGWRNVQVVCEDAATFKLPGLAEPNGKVSLITMSYSLSMIESYFAVVDRVRELLAPEGFFGVADFYCSGRSTTSASQMSGSQNRQVSWFNRWFWQIWFDFDHVHLSPGRREYLEYKFGTIKALNGRNRFVIPWIVRIPYYVWLGCPQERQLKESAVHKLAVSKATERRVTFDDMHQPQQSINSSFNYQAMPWRLPYDPTLPRHIQFRSYIYAFTWEDPRVDLEFLNLTKDDSMFVITSAGDNALEYALKAGPKRIHCVDMNPCQNHLLELKLACISALNHKDFWLMFGEGYHPNFRDLLLDKLSPYLSSQALQYWFHNSSRFSSHFYKTGYSGLAIVIIEYWIKLNGIQNEVINMCHSRSLEEQKRIWNEKIRPCLFSGLIRKVLNNPIFMWNALGVPMNQMNMYLRECTTQQYIEDTLDPIPSRSLFRNDQYFYYLCLMQRYCVDSCPSYLTEKGFETLKDTPVTGAFRLHTSSILDTLKALPSESLTRSIVMDHMDWFDPKDHAELDEEIAEMARTTVTGGHVYWRSAGQYPWYNTIFEKNGFVLEPLGIREIGSGKSIDRVNMYASFWRGVKV